MKTSQKLFALIVPAMALIAVACGNSQSKTQQKEENVDNFSISETFKTGYAIYKCVGDTTFGANVEVYTERTVSIQWPDRFGDHDISNLQDSLIFDIFGATATPIDTAINAYLSHPMGYGDYELQEVDSVATPDENCRILSQEVEAKIVGFNERYIVYRIYEYVYMGGAHPVYGSKFLNYDIKHNNVLEFNEIFTAGSDDKLLDAVKSALLQQYYASSLKELEEKSGIFAESIHLTQNIYLTEKSIVFAYNPYDIGPWAIGEIEVPVAIDDLEPYLTPEAKDLFQ